MLCFQSIRTGGLCLWRSRCWRSISKEAALKQIALFSSSEPAPPSLASIALAIPVVDASLLIRSAIHYRALKSLLSMRPTFRFQQHQV